MRLGPIDYRYLPGQVTGTNDLTVWPAARRAILLHMVTFLVVVSADAGNREYAIKLMRGSLELLRLIPSVALVLPVDTIYQVSWLDCPTAVKFASTMVNYPMRPLIIGDGTRVLISHLNGQAADTAGDIQMVSQEILQW